MNISINQITPRRENNEIISVTVHFTARTNDGLINLSGSVPIEDFADKIDFEGLENEDKVRSLCLFIAHAKRTKVFGGRYWKAGMMQLGSLGVPRTLH